jgi:hypothetical protein
VIRTQESALAPVAPDFALNLPAGELVFALLASRDADCRENLCFRRYSAEEDAYDHTLRLTSPIDHEAGSTPGELVLMICPNSTPNKSDPSSGTESLRRCARVAEQTTYFMTFGCLLAVTDVTGSLWKYGAPTVDDGRNMFANHVREVQILREVSHLLACCG